MVLSETQIVPNFLKKKCQGWKSTKKSQTYMLTKNLKKP